MLNRLAQDKNVFQVDYRLFVKTNNKNSGKLEPKNQIFDLKMSTIGDIKVKAWSPAVPCKIPDNIVSSQFASYKGFTPSYEKEKRPCIAQLLTNEYQRIWWQEKESWDKRCRTKITTKKLLQRMVIKRKPKTVPVIDKPKKIKKPKKKKEEKVVETVKESKDDQKREEKAPPQKEEAVEKPKENKIEEST